MVLPMGGLRAQTMDDRAHFLLELFVVEDDAKGMGLEKRVVAAGLRCFLMRGAGIFMKANVFANLGSWSLTKLCCRARRGIAKLCWWQDGGTKKVNGEQKGLLLVGVA